MNRFHLMTYTAALALALSACASATRPGGHYALRQQLLLAQAGAPLMAEGIANVSLIVNHRRES